MKYNIIHDKIKCTSHLSFGKIDSMVIFYYIDRIMRLPQGYDNPIPTWLQAPIDCSKIPVLAGRYDNPISTRFLAPIDCSKLPALV